LTPFGERAGAERILDALIRGHLRQRPVRFSPHVIVGNDGVFADGLRRDGIPVTTYPMRLRFLPRCVRWLRGYLKGHQIRLVHTTMSHYHQFAWLASRGLNVKTLWFNHGPCSPKPWKGAAHFLPADATVVQGKFIGACHRGLTLSPPPREIAYGLEDTWLEPRPELRSRQRAAWGLGNETLAVGMLSRLQDWKRQHLLLDAIARLPVDVVARCRFFVAGTASLGVGAAYAENLRRRWETHPFRERIVLTGYVEADSFWEAMDVAVHCAFQDPFPLAVMEALAKGKIVIAADSGGIPEMIQHGINGWLLDPEDTTALAQRISAVVANFDTACSMSEAARRSVAGRFRQERLIREFEALYSEMLAPK
jgi:glycosyltransferase involved in cell wall biosynthesis